MNRRTLLLLIAAIGIAGLYGADQLYRTLYEGPRERLESRIEGLQKRAKTISTTRIEARRDSKRLEAYEAMSLPYDLEQARAAYQGWLLALVSKHGMTQAAVDPGVARPITVRNRTRKGSREVADRIAYTLRGRTDLPHLTSFLGEFYQAGHLHKITALTLNPAGGGTQLDVSISIETLALMSCERESTLSELAWDRRVSPPESFTAIARRNFFARGFSRALAETRLTAITYGRDGEAEAWFRLGASGGTERAKAGTRVPISLIELEVIDILPDRAFVRVDGQTLWISVGGSLAEVMAAAGETIAAPAAVESAEPQGTPMPESSSGTDAAAAAASGASARPEGSEPAGG